LNGPKGFDDFELKLGDIMRGERATLGKSLLDAQREIKIKANYLAAIEETDLGAFESPGFIPGYIRSYARYLGLDPDWAHQTFMEECGSDHRDGVSGQIKKAPKPKTGENSESAEKGSKAEDPFARSPIYAAPKESMWVGVNPGMIGSFAVLVSLIFGLGYGGWSVLREIQKVDIAPVETALGTAAPDASEAQGP
ncbi:MAG: helix-turn-helix domain-containing protein, partial [Mangrovicoccus sp.]|nr:helix-turn-helix domain-containing protein [Mangrovicoccus sp.]